MILEPSVETQPDDGAGRAAPVLVWRFDRPVEAVSSSVLGGGLGPRSWITNATVTFGYRETDPAAHAARIAAACGLVDPGGIGLLTGVDVTGFTVGEDGGAEVVATVGLGSITWAAAPEGQFQQWEPGTINIVAWVPEAVASAALVNLVATIAEAKVQALRDAGVEATGTPTDAVVVCCPAGAAVDDDVHRYGGPRSYWGSRVARAAFDSIRKGI